MSNGLPPVARFDSSSNVRIYRMSCLAFPGLVTHVYLVLGAGPVTLVDTGSGYGESTADLFAGLESVRRDFGENIGPGATLMPSRKARRCTSSASTSCGSSIQRK